MFASWSGLLVVLFAGNLAFSAPGQGLRSGPHQKNDPGGQTVNKGDYVLGKGEHFEPPGSVSISPNPLLDSD